MKYWVIAAILVGNMIIQSTLLPFVQVYGIQPDTLMVLVCSFGLLGGSYYGVFTGLAGGLLQDVLYGGPIGIAALQYMIVGYLMGQLNERIFLGKILMPTLCAFGGSIVRGLFMMVYLYFKRVDISTDVGLSLVILPEALYTALFMPLIFYLMSLLFRQRFMKKRWSFRRR
jgi:rod shape-determining protein MreD